MGNQSLQPSKFGISFDSSQETNRDSASPQTRVSPVLRYIRAYLKHHLNNNLSVAEGNLRFIERTIDQLGEIEAADEKQQRKLDNLRRQLDDAFNPLRRSINKIKDIQRKALQEITRFID